MHPLVADAVVDVDERPLDNTPITTGRYIAHVAVPCRDWPRLRVVSLAPMLAEVIRRMVSRESISGMF